MSTDAPVALLGQRSEGPTQRPALPVVVDVQVGLTKYVEVVILDESNHGRLWSCRRIRRVNDP